MDEFALIRRFFAGLTAPRADVVLPIGDDCALLCVPAGEVLAATTDTLVAGRHFPADAAPFDIGWKSLAVNLSDLAAMGAQPRWFTLALTLEQSDPDWLRAFADGLRACALDSGIGLVGGDTTRGPLSITITAMGSVVEGQALRRSGAQVGDAVCVTGTLGDAALALWLWQQSAGRSGPPAVDEPLFRRLHRPQPRVAAGRALRDIAHAAIDLSDGLAGDLPHLLDASGVGAEIRVDRLPMSPAFERRCPAGERLALQASGGDDYELCVCIPAHRLDGVRARLEVPLHEIGRIAAAPGLRWLDESGVMKKPDIGGYVHFK